MDDIVLPEVEESEGGDTSDDNTWRDHCQGMSGHLQAPADRRQTMKCLPAEGWVLPVEESLQISQDQLAEPPHLHPSPPSIIKSYLYNKYRVSDFITEWPKTLHVIYLVKQPHPLMKYGIRPSRTTSSIFYL